MSLSPRKSILSVRSSISPLAQSPTRSQKGSVVPQQEFKIDLSSLSSSSYTSLASLLETALQINPIKELQFLTEELLVFFDYKSDLIAKNKPLSEESAQTFYEKIHIQLETLVIEAVSMKNIEERNEKIKKIKSWYMDKIESFKQLSQIKQRTEKNLDQIDDVEKERTPESPSDINNHRCQIFGFESAKNKINEFRRKVIISEPNQELDLDSEHYYFRDNRIKKVDAIDNAFNNIADNFNSTYYTTKTSRWNKTAYNNTATTGGWFHQSTGLDFFDKEVKGTYAFHKPNYDYSNLVIEKEIARAKNKELRQKRMDEEVKQTINTFGLERARYKQNIVKKLETTNLIKSYSEILSAQKDQEKKKREEKKPKQRKSIIEVKEEVKKEEEKPKVDVNNVKYITQFNEEIEESKGLNFMDYLNKEKNKEKIYNVPFQIEASQEKQNLLNFMVKKKMEKDFEIDEKYKNTNTESENKEITKEKNFNLLPSAISTSLYFTDKIFSVRMINSKLNDINLVGGNKHKKYLKPLSVYDNDLLKRESHSRPKTEGNYFMETFSKFPNNYLKMRKTLSQFNETKMKSSKIFKKSNKKIKIQLTKISSNPKNKMCYPQNYLPLSGNGLLASNF